MIIVLVVAVVIEVAVKTFMSKSDSNNTIDTRERGINIDICVDQNKSLY